MGRRLRIKLEIVDPDRSMVTEIGKHPTEPGIGRDPTTEQYRLAYGCSLMLLGIRINNPLTRKAVEKAFGRPRMGKRAKASGRIKRKARRS